jgi:hypothetical protein
VCLRYLIVCMIPSSSGLPTVNVYAHVHTDKCERHMCTQTNAKESFQHWKCLKFKYNVICVQRLCVHAEYM